MAHLTETCNFSQIYNFSFNNGNNIYILHPPDKQQTTRTLPFGNCIVYMLEHNLWLCYVIRHSNCKEMWLLPAINMCYCHMKGFKGTSIHSIMCTICLRKILNETCFFDKKMVASLSDTGLIWLFPPKPSTRLRHQMCCFCWKTNTRKTEAGTAHGNINCLEMIYLSRCVWLCGQRGAQAANVIGTFWCCHWFSDWKVITINDGSDYDLHFFHRSISEKMGVLTVEKMGVR